MNAPLSAKRKADRHDERADKLFDLAKFVPREVYPLNDPQTDLPRIAKDKRLIKLIEDAVRRLTP